MDACGRDPMTRLTFEPRGIPRAIAASVERDSVRGECATSTCLRWARKVDGRGAWQLSNLTRPRQVDLPPSPVSNHAPPNNDDETTTPLPLPPLANSCMPPPRPRRVLPHSATRPREQARRMCRHGGWGAREGGLGLGPRVLGGVAVG